jgi:hypothetical protein
LHSKRKTPLKLTEWCKAAAIADEAGKRVGETD